MSVVQAEAGWFGEGDDFFWVDGEKYPSIEGTGSEDYFNDAWGLHVNDAPYYGVTVAEGTGLGSRMTAYRWHLVGSRSRSRSRSMVEIEHKGWTFNADGSVKSAFGERVDLMSSVAFWYQEGIALDQPPVPYGSARLPQGNALQIEVENSLPRDQGREGQGLGLPGPLLVEGRPALRGRRDRARSSRCRSTCRRTATTSSTPQLAQGSDYGVYTVLLDGKPPDVAACSSTSRAPTCGRRPQFDGYAYETYVGADYQVGWPRLTKGRHTLTFVCLGKREDVQRLHPRRGRHRAREDGSRGLGRGRERPGAASTPRAASRISRPRSRTRMPPRGASRRWRFKDRGRGGAARASGPREGAQGSRIRTCRLMAGNAIAAIGKGAAPAVPALMAACSVKDEQIHVLRACASALGAIGKPAGDAGAAAPEEARGAPAGPLGGGAGDQEASSRRRRLNAGAGGHMIARGRSIGHALAAAVSSARGDGGASAGHAWLRRSSAGRPRREKTMRRHRGDGGRARPPREDRPRVRAAASPTTGRWPRRRSSSSSVPTRSCPGSRATGARLVRAPSGNPADRSDGLARGARRTSRASATGSSSSTGGSTSGRGATCSSEWVPRLSPGVIAAAFHGVIRTGHAVRSLDAVETPARRRELAEGLGYWAATTSAAGIAGPRGGRHGLPSRRDRQSRRASGGPPDLARATSPTASRRSIAFPPFAGVADLVDASGDPSALLSNLTETFAAVYLSNVPAAAARSRTSMP